MDYKAFGGAVVLTMTAPNMKTMIVREAMERAIPESKEWPLDSTAAILFANIAQLLGRTASIEFGGDDNPYVDGLAAFWHFAKTTTDYRAIWDAFILMPPEINNEWMTALNPADDARLKAPAEVAPTAPTDEELEAQGEDGKKKYKRGTNTSKPLTPASPPL